MTSGAPSRRAVLRRAALFGAGITGTSLTALASPASAAPPTAAALGPAPTVPAPQSWAPGGESFTFGLSCRIVVASGYAADLEADAHTFSEDLAALTGAGPEVVRDDSNAPGTGDVFVTLGSSDDRIGDEGYVMRIGPVLRIEARTAAGAFHGTRTLLQLLRPARTVAGGTIRDWPRYPERGLLVANEPKSFSTQWWQETVRELSYLRMNMLWYYVGYHRVSLAQMKEVAAYAKRYHIAVVPQFNMPGHLETEIGDRPDLHLPGRPQSLDLSREAGYAYARDQLATLLPQFTTAHWHLGADEYLLGSDYDLYPQLAEYARAHYGADATGVDTAYGFVNICNSQVRAAGKTMRIWNDGLLPDPVVEVDTDVVIEHWIDSGRSAAELLAAGYQVQNSNLDFLYYDLGGRHTDPEKIYDGFRVGLFSGSSVPDDTPGLRGAKLHVWTVPPDAEDEVHIGNNLTAPLRSLAQITWGSPRPAPDYQGFVPTIAAVGRAPGNTLWLGNETGPAGRAFCSTDGAAQHVFTAGGAAGGVLHWYWSELTASVTDERWPGGAVSGEPAGYAHGPELVLFARGTDDSLHHWSQLPGASPASDDWGAGPGTVTSAPTGFALGTQQHVFYRTSDGTLAHRYRARGDTHVYAENWGGELTGDPASFTQDGAVHVFARGEGDSLRHWWYADGGVGLDDWDAPAGTVTSDPAALALGTQQHVFYRTSDGTLAHRYRAPGDTHVYAENWGGELTGSPVAYRHDEEVHVFARGSGGFLRHWYWYPDGGGVRRDDWGGAGTVTDDVTGLAVGDQEHVFYRTDSGSLGHRFYDHSAGRVVTEDWGGSIPQERGTSS